MMELPINEKELDYIIKTLETRNPSLYAKLWSHKLKNQREKKINGFS